jgi:hypothetical protein
MKLSPGSRKTASRLSDSIHHRLDMYAIAAGAAGVGILALAQPVEAKIVYTAAHKNAIAGIKLDLNHDGIADFKLCRSDNTYYHCIRTVVSRPPGFVSRLLARPMNKLNGVVGKGYSASPLVAGTPIGGKAAFPPGDSRMATGEFSGTINYGGPWLNVTNRYLGFKFVIKGKIHYGWARLNVHWKHPQTAILTGYAYETIPGKSIIAGKTNGPDDSTIAASVIAPLPAKPQPASLGILALGAPSVPLWRRKESLDAPPE